MIASSLLFITIFSIVVAQPGVPTDFTATTISKTRIDLAWVKGQYADTTYIERNLSSSWIRGEGMLIYNYTGMSYQDISCLENTHYYYQAWSWNQTDGFTTNFVYANNTTYANQPPFFGSPTPTNGSTNNPLSLNWNIPINDIDSDLFNWNINCSNGQTNSSTGSSNGTKSLSLTSLAYSTTYTIWVNATDPTGSSLYTKEWYTFTTKTNQPPTFGSPTPTNGSTNNPLSLNWNIPINDIDSDLFNWNINCNGQTNSSTGSSNGTKSLSLTSLAYSTTYTIWVNATDPTGSGLYTRSWLTFTTKENTPPVITTTIDDTTAEVDVQYSIDYNATDADGDSLTWSLLTNASFLSIVPATGVLSGTPTNANVGTYYVNVSVSDGNGGSDFTNFTLTVIYVYYPPAFTDNSPTQGTTGDPFTFNITTSNTTKVSSINVTWTHGTLGCTNISLNPGINKTWNLTITLDNNLSSMTYTIIVTDTSHNKTTGPKKTVLATDNDKPTIMDHTPILAHAGQLFVFNITVTDNIHVSEVWIEYWFDGYVHIKTNLVNDKGNLWHKTISINLTVLVLHYIISVVDSSNNWMNNSIKVVTIAPDHSPSTPEQPTGATSGRIYMEYTYRTSTTDLDNDEVYYKWSTGENVSEWLGPYKSGESVYFKHSWNTKGSYQIKAKAKDVQGLESDWSDPLPISMPYSYNPILQLLEWLFERFPNAFPILQQLLGY
jgi:hypothetical protein